MRLSDYLAQSDTSDAAFAEVIGVSRQALWRYRSGARRPEWDVLERIVCATGGSVTPNDFLLEASFEPRPTPEQAGAGA